MTASRQGSATSDFVGSLQDAIQKNPVSAALIGMGVLWMFTGGRNITAAAALFPAAAKATAAGAASGFAAFRRDSRGRGRRPSILRLQCGRRRS